MAVPTDIKALTHELAPLTANQRIARLLEAPDIIRVVRSLPVTDLFSTIKEVGVADCLEIIELLSPEQFRGFIDLDGWQKDRVAPKHIATWLEAIYAANPARAVQQFLGLDLEMITLLFKIYARVYDMVEEEPMPDDIGIHTISPDHRYCIVFDDSQPKLAEVLKHTLERLFGVDMRFCLNLLEALRWEMPSPLEEEAYRWRSGRMADLGFFPANEAREIFGYIDPDRTRDVAPPRRDETTELSFALPKHTACGLIGKALGALPQDDKDRVYSEAVLLANRIIMAIGADPGSESHAKEAFARALRTAGIGLGYRAKADVERATNLLKTTPLAELFRIGHSLTLRLSRNLRARIRNPASGLAGNGLLRLDSPLQEVAAGLLKPIPLFYEGLTHPESVVFRPFESLEDVAATTAAVVELAFRAALLGEKCLGFSDDVAEEIGVVRARTGPGHSALLNTWMARVILAKPSGFVALTDDDLAALKGKDPSAGIDALKELAAKSVPLPGATNEDDAKTRAENFARVSWAGLVDENKAGPEFVRTAFTTRWASEQLALEDA